jgi:hypothetical protein
MGVRVRQRPDKPGWWLFIDHQGKQKKKHFADKETALRVARQVRERLALGDFSITEEQPEAKPFSAYFETWLNTQTLQVGRTTAPFLLYFQQFMGLKALF